MAALPSIGCNRNFNQPRSSKNGKTKIKSAGNQRLISSLVGTSETTRATIYPKSFSEWLAGIIDGDGTIGIAIKKHLGLQQLSIRVTNKLLQDVEMFAENSIWR